MFHPQLRSTYVLAGALRWVELDGSRAVLRVDAAGGPARLHDLPAVVSPRSVLALGPTL